jgi:hypothetical protein
MEDKTSQVWRFPKKYAELFKNISDQDTWIIIKEKSMVIPSLTFKINWIKDGTDKDIKKLKKKNCK